MVRRSISPHRNHLRSAVCDPLAGDPQGAWPSIWSDLLATSGRMAEARDLGLNLESCTSKIERARPDNCRWADSDSKFQFVAKNKPRTMAATANEMMNRRIGESWIICPRSELVCRHG